MQVATCFVSSNGLKVTVEQAKCVQANAFVEANLFQQFIFTSEAPIVFKINLNTLIVGVYITTLSLGDLQNLKFEPVW